MCFATRDLVDITDLYSTLPLWTSQMAESMVTTPSPVEPDQPLACSYCQREFRYPSVLRTHERVHTGEKPFLCRLCDRSFAQNSQLSSHMRVHTGARPYRCEICLKDFSQACNLKTHRRLHSGEKPMICDVCGKKFAQRHHLTAHKVVHSGDRPFQCQICSKTFAFKSNLMTHVKTCLKNTPIRSTSEQKFVPLPDPSNLLGAGFESIFDPATSFA